MAVGAIHDCLILHGQYGYTKDFPIEQRLRDVIGQQIADGTPQIQKLVVARRLFARD
jgi:cyclohexanecarboxyl-CoA dehydrogenase